MKIRQAEQLTGISGSNIRFYEKEGLIKPERGENNYREYSEEDVELLKKIKVLRMLGVPVNEILEIEKGQISLEDAMKRRLDEIRKETQNLRQTEEICSLIVKKEYVLADISEDIMDEKQAFWAVRLRQVLKEDMTKKIIGKCQMNLQVMLMLEGALLLNLAVSLAAGKWFLKADVENILPELLPFGILCVLCALLGLSENAAVQVTAFVLAAAVLSPLLMKLCGILAAVGGETAGTAPEPAGFALFWGMTAVLVLILWILFSRAGEAGKRRWWLLAASGMFTLVSGGVFWFWQERFFLPVLLALTVAAYISINWEKANRECENGECSRFYAVTVAGRIVNVLGTALAMKGRTESFGRWKDTH